MKRNDKVSKTSANILNMTEDDKKNISMDLKIQEAVDFLVAEAKLV